MVVSEPLSKEKLMELLETYFPNEVESRPMNVEAFCNVLLSMNRMEIKQVSDDEPCNFCGTPNREFPERVCARTPICVNYKMRDYYSLND